MRKAIMMTVISLTTGVGCLTGGCSEGPPPVPIVFNDVTEQSGMDDIVRTYAAAAADYDNDGWPDLAVSLHSYTRLYRNRRDGTFQDVTEIGLESKPMDSHGVSWVDLDNDGWLDLYVSVGAQMGTGARANRVYRNDGGQRFERIMGGDVLEDPMGRSRSACPTDIDGDGKIDLILMNLHNEGREQRIAVQRNNGFEDWAPASAWQDIRAQSVKVIDIDNIGSPVYICAAGGPDAGRVYRRNDQGQFVDVTETLGLSTKGNVQSVAVGDMDNDGDLDLYYVLADWAGPGIVVGPKTLRFVINGRADSIRGFRFRVEGKIRVSNPEFMKSQIYPLLLGRERIEMPTYSWEGSVLDPALEGKPTMDTSMDGNKGFLWRDEDGSLVFNFVSPLEKAKVRGMGTGGQIEGLSSPLTLVERFDVPLYEPGRPACGNRLYKNNGGRFIDVTKRAGVGDTGSGTDAAFADFDNDGDQDLYVVNGHVPFGNPPNILYRNNNDSTFTDVTEEAKVAGPTQGRGDGVVIFDFDRDGDLDMFLTNGHGTYPFSHGPLKLYRNDTKGGNWLDVKLVGTVSNRMSLGATVTARIGKKVLRHQVSALTGRLATSVLPVHIGLGEAQEADLEVRWPSGRVLRVTGKAGQTLELIEPESD